MIPYIFAFLAVLGGIVRGFVQWLQRLDAASEEMRFSLEPPDSPHPVAAPSVLDDASKSLTVVVPAYNEKERLPATLDEMLGFLERKRQEGKGPRGRSGGQGRVVRDAAQDGAHTRSTFSYEVIVVDDGSSDATARVVAKYSRQRGFDQVRLLRFPRNRGKGAAVRAGVLSARGKLVLFADADGATRFADVELLTAEAERRIGEILAAKAATSGAPGLITPAANDTFVSQATARPEAPAPEVAAPPVFVLGSRAHLEAPSRAKRTFLRTFLMRGFHALVAVVVGRQVRDTQCGFKLFTRSAAQAIVINQRTARFGFDVELIRIAQKLKIPMSEVQVTWTEIPGSKVRFTSMIGMAVELAATLVGYTFGSWSIRDPAGSGR